MLSFKHIYVSVLVDCIGLGWDRFLQICVVLQAFVVPLASFALAYGFFWVLRKAAASVIGMMVASVEMLLLGCSYHFFVVAHSTPSTLLTSTAFAQPYADPFGGLISLPKWVGVTLGILCAVAAVGILLLVMFWWKQLSLCTTVLKSAAMVLHEAPPKFLALLPIFTASAFAVHTAFALWGILHLIASGEQFTRSSIREL